MSETSQPSWPPKTASAASFIPSIHWAEHQFLPSTQGSFRRLYDCELMYVYTGSLLVEFEDMTEPILYEAGDLLVLPPAVRHRIRVGGEPLAHLIGVHFDLYDELEITFDLDMVVKEDRVDERFFCAWPLQSDGSPLFTRCYRSVPLDIVRWMEEIRTEFKSKQSGSELACRGYMLLALSALLRLQPSRARTGAASYREQLLRLIDELQQHMHLHYSNAAMADRLNISEDHFIRLFKQTFELTPQQYLQHMRHQAAKRMLRETDYKIQHIGKLVGYEDLHNFSHIFKKWQGVSPRAYRSMHGIL
ncbi:AraC-type DNA-binding protein [Paenibacillus sp. UNCCL117]|uniref:AraC family transcriptional regulator n=1 Tax=unclassified Paenibacillus TaxID=185978 RepID=UPI000882AD01|nr:MULTISPECIES: AraC family transcriptional regulator [unclassified Paenibacillus]SDE68785.1 AraC-type DNA-binding protein [Paenibacillus sp. cl123]SFW66504.1 AraC-type DNA-binding protein [Paenibacillus sp. UNCCL117]